MTMRATTTAHLPGRQSITEGDLYADDHDWVREYPQFFEDIEVQTERPVERATAAPGEKRDTKPEAVPGAGSTDDLGKLTKAELVDRATATGVDTSGTKAELIERITAAS